MSISTVDGLRDVFFDTMRNHAGDRGYEFSRTIPIRQFATQGATAVYRRITDNGWDPFHPQIMREITEAENHSKQFIDGMIRNHRGRTGAQGGVLEDVDFQYSSSWFSPMWPFCT